MSQLPSPKFYSTEQVQQILNLAIARSDVGGLELSRDQLCEIASELGMDIKAVQKAEQDWSLQQKKQEFNLYRKIKVKNSWAPVLPTV